MKRILLWINFVAACVVVVGVFLQVYFITAYFTGEEGALDAHSVLGFLVIHGAEAIVFLTALGAFWKRWRWIGISFFLLLLGTVQIFLAPPDEDPASGWVHGFHGLLALFVLITAAIIAHHGMKELGLRATPASSET